MPRRSGPGAAGHRFRAALDGNGVAIIAEIKRRSPSRGDLRPDAPVPEVARAYQRAGAACVSVLTDEERFGGSADDLRKAREAVDIPLLRKDFLSTPEDVHDTVSMGADAMLLIVQDVPAERIRPLQELALSLGVDVVTEVRTEQELEVAVASGAYMIAVNQRNDPKDKAFTVEYDKAVAMGRLFDQYDRGIVRIAASGIGVPGGTTLAEIADAGYHAALIGEALVTAADPVAALDAMRRPAAHR